MVGKESSRVLKRDLWHGNIWEPEPQDGAKDYTAFAECASCVDVKREGHVERSAGGCCSPCCQ